MTGLTCAFELCNREVALTRRTTLCEAHYKQWVRLGRPGELGSLRPLRTESRCSVTDCLTHARRNGLCPYHSERRRRGAALWPSCRGCGRERRNRDGRRLCPDCIEEVPQ